MDKIHAFKKDPSIKEKYKLVIAFKYDKSGILTVKHADVVSSTNDSHSLKLTEKLFGPSPLTSAQKSKIKKRLREADKRDKTLEKLKVIYNEFESLIYSSRSFLEDEETQPYLRSEEEKEKLLLYINEEEEWLEEKGTTADYEVIKNKVKVLEKKINPIKKRKTQREQVAEQIEKSQKKLDDIEKSFKKYTKRRDWLPAEELENFEELLTETRQYFHSISDLEIYPKNERLPFRKSDLEAEVKKVSENCKFALYNI